MKVFLDEFFFFFAIWMKVYLTVPVVQGLVFRCLGFRVFRV